MWFSYWIQAKGYGAAGKGDGQVLPDELSAEEIKNLRGWIGQMTIANTVAVAGALIIAFAFLILGTELLKPEGLMPEDDKIARTLGLLLGRIVGPAGFWFMIAAVFVTFMSSMLSGQDGFMRMFADGAREAVPNLGKRRVAMSKQILEKVIAITLLGIVPAVVCAVSGEPLTLLKLAGTIELCHIPVVAGLVLYLNRQTLPRPLRPSLLSTALTIAAGAFFAAFGIIFLLELLGIIELTARR